MLTDMHSHILPGADHGSDSVECSLAQLKRAEEIGIGTIVATPHFYLKKDDIPDFLERREKCYTDLMNAYTGNIRILKGAEVTLYMGLQETEGLSKLCIEGTNYIMIEMPIGEIWEDWVYNSLFEIEANHGVKIIIAHIDRYEKQNIPNLLDLDFQMQINAAAFMPLFGRKKMIELIDNDTANILGSDVHGKTAPEYDQLVKAIKLLGEGRVTHMMHNAERILSGNVKKHNGGPEL